MKRTGSSFEQTLARLLGTTARAVGVGTDRGAQGSERHRKLLLTYALILATALTGMACSSVTESADPSVHPLASEKVRPQTQEPEVYLVALDQAALRSAWDRFNFHAAVPTDLDFERYGVLVIGTGEGSGCPVHPTALQASRHPSTVIVTVKTSAKGSCSKDFTPRSFAIQVPRAIAADPHLRVRIPTPSATMAPRIAASLTFSEARTLLTRTEMQRTGLPGRRAARDGYSPAGCEGEGPALHPYAGPMCPASVPCPTRMRLCDGGRRIAFFSHGTETISHVVRLFVHG